MFAAATYRARRAALATALDAETGASESGSGGIALIPASGEAPMNYAGNAYPYWQDGTFRYLAGDGRAGLVLALDTATGEATLYGDDASVDDVVWTGPAPSVREMAGAAGIGHTAPAARLDGDIVAARDAGRAVHTLPAYRPEHRVAGTGAAPSEAFIRALVAVREVKTDEEIAEIEDALSVTSDAFRAALAATRDGAAEHDVAGAILGVVHGADRRLAYGLICSVRGETLHNVSYHRTLREGQMLLVDAGATSPRGYASDLTRTWPVSGRFTDLQRHLYDTVRAAHDAAIAAMRPGVRFADVHRIAAATLTRGLQAAGFMRGDVAASVEAGAHALFFPHGLGHQMGLDVHDMEALGEDRVGYDGETRRSEQFGTAYLRMGKALREGHVITVEPGLYAIPALIDLWRAENRHADFIAYDRLGALDDVGGIRLENDVLVTATGARALAPSRGEPVPMDADAIAAMVGG